MPHFASIIEPDGPIINVRVALSAPRRQALTDAGLEIPLPMNARLLIDTGASMTLIDESFVTGLQLKPTGSIQMHTPSTGATSLTVSTYDVEMHFTGAGASTHTFPSMGVVGADFSEQTIDGLFGRDALGQARLVYSGPDNNWMLSF